MRQAIETLFTQCDGHRINRPDDFVFDEAGGFWFTDPGHAQCRSRNRGAVYYALPCGTFIKQVLFPIEMPNCIALSTDGHTLYVAETMTGRLWAWEIEAPGVLKGKARNILGGTSRIVIGLPGLQSFDSMAVDADGNIHIGPIPSGISVANAYGKLITRICMLEQFATNLCFGGAQMSTAYIMFSSTGRIVGMDSKYSGHPLTFSGSNNEKIKISRTCFRCASGTNCF